ncbi:hypothetical protein BC628DRAFT_928794 [Trametes gibbosa]|nr:hypothetical protein BC628DRAFT_928794 [Trametes gibbosa]
MVRWVRRTYIKSKEHPRGSSAPAVPSNTSTALNSSTSPSTNTMQLTALLAVIAAVAVTQVSAAASIVRQINAPGSTDENALYDCLLGYRSGNWNGETCGGRGWFKGGQNYDNPNDCWDACAQLLIDAINQGASDVECDDHEGGSRCWIGYH